MIFFLSNIPKSAPRRTILLAPMYLAICTQDNNPVPPPQFFIFLDMSFEKPALPSLIL